MTRRFDNGQENCQVALPGLWLTPRGSQGPDVVRVLGMPMEPSKTELGIFKRAARSTAAGRGFYDLRRGAGASPGLGRMGGSS